MLRKRAECEVWKTVGCDLSPPWMSLAALAEKVQTSHLGSLGGLAATAPFSSSLEAPVSSFLRLRQAPAAVVGSGM